MPFAELTDAQAASNGQAVERVMRLVEVTMGRNVAALTRSALVVEAAGFDTSELWRTIAHASVHARYVRAWLGDHQAPLPGTSTPIH